LADKTALPEKIPVVIASDRTQVAPVIGYRHISGIEPWEPHEKARFIASLVEVGTSFADVGDLVGEGRAEVAAQFRNYGIVRQAASFGADTTRAVRYFGVFTRAMNSQALREHIKAPKPADVSTDAGPLPADSAEHTKELLLWLFGDADTDPVIGESRDITDLGKVVASPDGLAILRETRDLQSALVASGGLEDRLRQRLKVAIGALEAAAVDIHAYRNDEGVQDLLAQCTAALEGLTNPDA
jgi:hypothetical protein